MMFVSIGIGLVLAIALIAVVSHFTGGTVQQPSALTSSHQVGKHGVRQPGAQIRQERRERHLPRSEENLVLRFLPVLSAHYRCRCRALSAHLHIPAAGADRPARGNREDRARKARGAARAGRGGHPLRAWRHRPEGRPARQRSALRRFTRRPIAAGPARHLRQCLLRRTAA